ncbi:MAG: lysophospholipid acyltransferase family protein [Roseibacillus sp.]|jgi:1-acyl-sn-glycerol-3-phosphate acyltransferase
MTTPYWIARALTRAILTANSGGLEVVNRDKRIHSGGAIVAANHASYLDPPIVAGAYTREVSFLARSTLFKGVGGWLYPKLNAFPIDREHADLKSMKMILRKLKNGDRILMFPEGTRTSDGELQAAKPGIGMLVAKSKVPVQPVRIFGAYESWPRGGKYRPHRIRVVIGDPVEFDQADLNGKSREGYQRISDQLMKAIGELTPEG